MKQKREKEKIQKNTKRLGCFIHTTKKITTKNSLAFFVDKNKFITNTTSNFEWQCSGIPGQMGLTSF